MNFQHDESNAFENVDLHFLSTIATQAAIALENAQLYETIRTNASELTALYNATSYLFKADSLLNLGYQVVQAVIQEFGQADCGLMVIDKQENRVVRLARSGTYHVEPLAQLQVDGSGLVPEVLRTGKLIYAPDVNADSRYVANNPDTKSELVIPLYTANGVTGVLDLQSVKKNAFSQRDLRILTAFAERVAGAIENMQLYEEVNRYTGELEWRVAKRTAELSRAKERVEAILSNSSDAIILVDERAIIRQANPAFSTLFGYTSDEVYAKPLTLLFQSDQIDALSEKMKKVIESQQSERIELSARHGDGTIFITDLALALTIQDSDEVRLICSMRDITGRKQIEENLRRSLEQEKELSELKSRFVSMASHEFRTPLATVQSSSDLLIHYGDRLSEARKTEHLDKIQTQVKRLTGLLDDILTLSKADNVGLTLNPSLVNMGQFANEIVSEIRQIAPSHQVHFSVTRNCSLMLDEKLMRQAIMNLLSNAIKYSPAGSNIYFNAFCGNKQLVLYIRDEGIGIPEEDQPRLFEVFHRAKNVGAIPGTGLGLAIVKQAVEAHNGTISYTSEVGKGTTFTLNLPITEGEKSP